VINEPTNVVAKGILEIYIAFSVAYCIYVTVRITVESTSLTFAVNVKVINEAINVVAKGILEIYIPFSVAYCIFT
jgi:hypothetical protein